MKHLKPPGFLFAYLFCDLPCVSVQASS